MKIPCRWYYLGINETHLHCYNSRHKETLTFRALFALRHYLKQISSTLPDLAQFGAVKRTSNQQVDHCVVQVPPW